MCVPFQKSPFLLFGDWQLATIKKCTFLSYMFQGEVQEKCSELSFFVQLRGGFSPTFFKVHYESLKKSSNTEFPLLSVSVVQTIRFCLCSSLSTKVAKGIAIKTVFRTRTEYSIMNDHNIFWSLSCIGTYGQRPQNIFRLRNFAIVLTQKPI